MADRFRFKRHASVGAEAAEDDQRYLATCFVDTGDLTCLLETQDPPRLVLGRTGTGKSALLLRLSDRPHAILIQPESLSFNHLANSTVLPFFADLGVKLDLFFKLLWRHVFTVELLRQRYSISDATSTASFFDRFKGSIGLKDKTRERALRYLAQWGNRFWEETEYRVKEITANMETQLAGSVKAALPHCEFKAGATDKLSSEERIEVVQRGQRVVDSIQMKELSDVLTFLDDEVFEDPQNPYYLCIDRLDDNWTDDRCRYLLIRRLI